MPVVALHQFSAGHAYLDTVLGALALQPRHDYRRIDCGAISIRTLMGWGTLEDALLTDTRTALGEEYVGIEGHGWVRADLVELVGVSLDGACSI